MARKRKLKMSDLQVGDKVRILVTKHAYYSGYGGRPEILLREGAVGIVGAVRVPCVRYIKGQQRYFVCVDFHMPEIDERNPEQRGAFFIDELEGV